MCWVARSCWMLLMLKMLMLIGWMWVMLMLMKNRVAGLSTLNVMMV